MSDDARQYRERAAAETANAGKAALLNVRERSERAAAKWNEMAERADRVAVSRQGREAEAAERRSDT